MIHLSCLQMMYVRLSVFPKKLDNYDLDSHSSKVNFSITYANFKLIEISRTGTFQTIFTSASYHKYMLL